MSAAPRQSTSPLVSVVIPAYNAMPYLPIAVRSALAQTHDNLEVIVVDDGSTDATTAWVNSSDDHRVRLLTKPNGGAASARNAAIDAACGEYVAFLDADDYWEPEKIAAQVRRAEQATAATLVDTWAYYIDANGRTIGPPVGSTREGDVWKHMVQRCLVPCGSTMLVPRQCFVDIGPFREDIPNAEDWDMWIRLSRRYPLAVVTRGLVAYRQHGGNKHRNYEGTLSSMLRIIDDSLHDEKWSIRRLKRRARANAYLHVATRTSTVPHNARNALLLAARAAHMRPRLVLTRRFVTILLSTVNQHAPPTPNSNRVARSPGRP